MKTTRLVATAVVVLAVLIVSFSQASAQTMYACVNNKTGAMRYVTGPGLCAKNETQVSWNVTGPQGAQGPAGPAGPTGPQGPAAGVKVYDADDNYLCDLIGINDEWWDHIANSPKFQFQFLTCFIPSLQSFMSIDRFVGSDRLVAPVFLSFPTLVTTMDVRALNNRG